MRLHVQIEAEQTSSKLPHVIQDWGWLLPDGKKRAESVSAILALADAQYNVTYPYFRFELERDANIRQVKLKIMAPCP